MSEITRKIDNLAGAHEAIKWALENILKGLAGGAVIMTLGRETRSKDQNSKLWPMLSDISEQVVWYDRKHSPEGWKDIITGSFLQCEFVPNLDGTGFVVVGLSTRKMNKAQFAELIEYIYSFGADKVVRWSEPSLQAFEQYRQE
jgi:hypothetical protein